MSKFSQLAHRIKSLPDIQSEQDRISIVQRVNKDAEEVARGLTIVFKQAKYIDMIATLPFKMVKVVEDAASFSVTQAKNLKKLIQREKFGSEQKISEHLENLKKKKQAVENQRNNAWAGVQSEAQSVQTILDIAVILKLDSVAILQETIYAFRRATASPPSSLADKDAVISAREGCKTAVQNSGLIGNVKKILDGAINANGDPKLLFEDDVKQFLEDHPELWDSLKLKLA
jgi:hypothetical protein